MAVALDAGPYVLNSPAQVQLNDQSFSCGFRYGLLSCNATYKMLNATIVCILEKKKTVQINTV